MSPSAFWRRTSSSVTVKPKVLYPVSPLWPARPVLLGLVHGPYAPTANALVTTPISASTQGERWPGSPSKMRRLLTAHIATNSALNLHPKVRAPRPMSPLQVPALPLPLQFLPPPQHLASRLSRLVVSPIPLPQ